MAEEHPTPRTYLIVFLLLLGLLVLTVGMAFVDLDRIMGQSYWSMAVALGIAVAKAVLILLFFMHVKTGPRAVWVYAMAGFLWLGIMLTLTFSDYVTRNRPPGESPKGEPRYLMVQMKP